MNVRKKMKSYIQVIVGIIISSVSLAHAGDGVDLGKADKVPNWAIGPLLVLPVEKVQERKLIAHRKESKRIGTIQQNYAEVDGVRHAFEDIHLWEVPNDGYTCEITTKPKNDFYFKIHLSQSLYDQTFYYVYIQRFKIGSDEAVAKNQYAVWDIKSRK